jgi:hypothetical protein
MKLPSIAYIVFAIVGCHGQSANAVGALPSAAAKSPQADEIIRIMHCLTEVELNWLNDSPPALEHIKRFQVGVRHDRETYPGDDVVIVAVFKSGTEGDVFELTHKGRGNSEKYNLENNGSFKLRGKGFVWPNEIFGGIWTHDYIERNIRRLMRGPKVWVRRKDVKTATSVACTYYGLE